MTDGTTVLLTLVVYKLVLLGIGLFAERRTHDEADFLIGGRSLGPLVAAISASASSSSVWTLLGVVGYAYSYGLSALWLLPACIGGFAINWYLIAPRLRAAGRRTAAMTLTEFLAGPRRGAGFLPVRVLAALILLVGFTGYVAQQFNGAGKTFAEQCGMSETGSIVLGASIIVAYTMLGGFWAVSLTDTLQGLMMALTAVALPLAALVAVGGPIGLVDGLRGLELDGYASVWPAGEGWAPLGTVFVLLSIAVGYPGQPHVVNRFMALRDDEPALRAARRYAMSWAAVVYVGMIVVGLCGRVLIPDAADSEGLFFTLTNHLYPPVLAGIVTAAVLSAIMSTADSQLLVAASSVSHDLGFKGRTERATLLRSRVVVLLVSAAAVVVSLIGSQRIFDSVLIAFTVVGAAFGPVLVVTLWRGPVSARRTLAAMSVGFGTAVLGYVFESTRASVVERTLPYALAFAVLLFPPAQRAGRA